LRRAVLLLPSAESWRDPRLLLQARALPDRCLAAARGAHPLSNDRSAHYSWRSRSTPHRHLRARLLLHPPHRAARGAALGGGRRLTLGGRGGGPLLRRASGATARPRRSLRRHVDGACRLPPPQKSPLSLRGGGGRRPADARAVGAGPPTARAAVAGAAAVAHVAALHRGGARTIPRLADGAAPPLRSVGPDGQRHDHTGGALAVLRPLGV